MKSYFSFSFYSKIVSGPFFYSLFFPSLFHRSSLSLPFSFSFSFLQPSLLSLLLKLLAEELRHGVDLAGEELTEWISRWRGLTVWFGYFRWFLVGFRLISWCDLVDFGVGWWVMDICYLYLILVDFRVVVVVGFFAGFCCLLGFAICYFAWFFFNGLTILIFLGWMVWLIGDFGVCNLNSNFNKNFWMNFYGGCVDFGLINNE